MLWLIGVYMYVYTDMEYISWACSWLSNFLLQLAKTYGSVFKVYFGAKKIIVLAGYKTVKEALVNYADEFGQREINNTFKFAEDHGKKCFHYIYIMFGSITIKAICHFVFELKLQSLYISHVYNI